jgi:hypothetical protein
MKKPGIPVLPEFIRTILILFVLFGLKISPVMGQPSPGASSNSFEKVYVHMDKLVYVTGESIRYKAYAADADKPGQKPCSKIVYFTLTGTKDRNVISWRINLSDNTVFGNFPIPGDTKSGIYVLKAYTSMMRNNPSESFFSQDILILNLTETTPASLMIDNRPYAQPPSGENQDPGNLRLSTSKAEYGVNEYVQLEIALPGNLQVNSPASLSVSVSAETPFDQFLNGRNIISFLTPDPKQAISKATCLYPMEDKSFILSGKVRNRKDNVPLAGGKVLLSVVDSISPKILFSQTDVTGKFVFYLGKIYDNDELILQLEDMDRSSDYSLELDKKIVDANQRANRLYNLRAEEIEFLNAYKNMRIVDAVYVKKSEVKAITTVTNRVNYFGPPDATVIPGDFADLVNFKEIADNIIPVVKFAIRNDGFNLQVLNSRSRVVSWNENKMLLLNGVPFNDLSYISTLGTKDIKRIEIITSNFFLGEITLRGLMSIYTYNNEIPENYIKNNTLTFRNSVIAEDKADADDLNIKDVIAGDHAPDFRNSLYWKPDLTVDNNKRVVSFKTSGLTGVYTIHVEGLTAEGYPVSGTASFEVKEQ